MKLKLPYLDVQTTAVVEFNELKFYRRQEFTWAGTVSGRVIAMSFPSTGVQSMYRNNISVSKKILTQYKYYQIISRPVSEFGEYMVMFVVWLQDNSVVKVY